jgi:hypothetical protein
VLPVERDASGVVTIARRDVRLIVPREPANDKRKPVMVRVSRVRCAAWKRAAGSKPVSTWLAELADAAAGVQ